MGRGGVSPGLERLRAGGTMGSAEADCYCCLGEPTLMRRGVAGALLGARVKTGVVCGCVDTGGFGFDVAGVGSPVCGRWWGV
jgi:hypothetical protein